MNVKLRQFRYRLFLSCLFAIGLTLVVAPRSITATVQTKTPDPTVVDFESLNDGDIRGQTTELGDWENGKGLALVDPKHAKSGKKCLHLAGGETASVELKLKGFVRSDGYLGFWAERWTSRVPFQFRIEKFANQQWTEIYNGDETIKVGRSFKSYVKLFLNDADIERLRFVVTAPKGTGILIDDLAIAVPVLQKIVKIEPVPFALPVLIGNEYAPLAKINVKTVGSLRPKSITRFFVDLQIENRNIRKFRIVPGGNQFTFPKNVKQRISVARDSEGKWLSREPIQLTEGDNYFWLVGKAIEGSDIDKKISASFNIVETSDSERIAIDSRSTQRLGIALRNSGDSDVHTYRIPGLTTTTKGSLIAVYDVRRDVGRDLPGNIDVGMSRSTDGGQTWEGMKIILDMGHDPKWRGDGIGDPSILVDQETGTIWVSATWSHGNRSWHGSGPGLAPEETGQWILTRSDDDGKSWSKPINITKQVKNPEWCFLLQGPGKGITLSDGTLVFPAQYQDTPQNNRLPRSTFIYSRDHGTTWKTATGAWDDTTESQIVETTDGKLMINCRTNRSSRRAVLTTSDMGQTWTQHASHLKALLEPRACMASLINVPRELAWRNLNSEHNRLLLFSNPDSANGRNHITIKASLDMGNTWPVEHQLLLDEGTGAGYSCMTMIDEKTVGILYEGSQSQLTFQRIPLKEILEPPKTEKTKNPATVGMQLPFGQRSKLSNRLRVARPFTSNMVLQANQPIRIWGEASPRSEVEIVVGDESKSVIANSQGEWLASFPARPVCKSPFEISVESNFETIDIKNVVVGEVWFCAGQSNMEWPLNKSTGGQESATQSNDSLLRLHQASGRVRGSVVVFEPAQFDYLDPDQFSQSRWQVASPQTTSEFSAIGYWFGKKLRTELDVPIGIIDVSAGGTPIESWLGRETLSNDVELWHLCRGDWRSNDQLDLWCRKRAQLNLSAADVMSVPRDEHGPNHPFKPGFMFEASVRPFAPLSIAGVLWYQGESNADSAARAKIYNRCFPKLVDTFRRQFQTENLPVAFVQLPALSRTGWPRFRELQRRSLARLKNVGMAIAIDTGDMNNVHPAVKEPVADRLAAWALVKVYQRAGTSMGPLYKRHRVDNQQMVIQFELEGGSLETTDGRSPNHFELAGRDHMFYPAEATIRDKTVVLKSANVGQPVTARYAWRPFPDPRPNLINSNGLPASPFSTETEERLFEE
ncbi:MAG: exo-alpha-sialidase [Planctomycetota bacterium]